MATRGIVVFGGSCLLAGAVVYYVQATESDTKLVR